MDTRPAIIISSFDLERLEQLLESEKYRKLPGIDALQRELDRATIVAPSEVPPDVITMNSSGRFVDDATGTEYRLSLVYPGQTDVPNAVSVLAPVGSALLGLSVGQSIAWQAPGGRELRLRVLEVTYQPEASGEFHR
ncbi:MAG: nucleoside diphosphate kinase regulator [Gallionellales bacterium RBG_16_56_9]|nr:MAG: nucleoside diphosphate kinase regulator [Gallionellales bacterium RBG_16_56_9]